MILGKFIPTNPVIVMGTKKQGVSLAPLHQQTYQLS